MPNFRPYPLATIYMNRFGNLEIWRGSMSPFSDKECDLYVQLDSDIDAILDSLPASESGDIRNGWRIETHFLDDMYFGDQPHINP